MTGKPQMFLPWSDQDVMRLCVTLAVGLLAVVVSWFGMSGSAETGNQALWLNIGVAGLVITMLGNAVWLLRGRREVGGRRAELVSLQQDFPSGESGHLPMPALNDTVTMSWGLVRAEGMSRVHRPDCPLVDGKQWQPADVGDGEPCGVCEP